MRVAFTLDFRNPTGMPWGQFYQDCLWLMVEAEAMGFDVLLIQEHFFMPDGYGPSVPIFINSLIERTKTARVGSYSYILPLHHAAQLAQETAVLDHLSGGRLEVCVAMGHRLAEYEAFGYSPKTRPSRMEEGLTVLKKAWTGEPFSFEGKYYNLKDIEVRPEPLQKPHPPLWVGAASPVAAERAGRHGAHLHGAIGDAEFYAAYHRGLAQAGIDPKSMRISKSFAATTTYEDPDVEWERNKHLHFERWKFYAFVNATVSERENPPANLSPEMFRPATLVGPPEMVLDAIHAQVDGFPVTDLICSGPSGGIPLRTEGYDSIKLFADKVLPKLRDL